MSIREKERTRIFIEEMTEAMKKSKKYTDNNPDNLDKYLTTLEHLVDGGFASMVSMSKNYSLSGKPVLMLNDLTRDDVKFYIYGDFRIVKWTKEDVIEITRQEAVTYFTDTEWIDAIDWELQIINNYLTFVINENNKRKAAEPERLAKIHAQRAQDRRDGQVWLRWGMLNDGKITHVVEVNVAAMPGFYDIPIPEKYSYLK